MNEFMRIGDICDILNGYAFKSSKYVADGIRVIRITNVQKGFVEDTNPQYYPVSEQREIEKYMLCEGDLLISLTGNVGRVGLLSAEMLPAALNQRVACIRIRNPAVIYKPFLFHLLNSDYFENKCILASQGVAQKNMSTEWLKEYPIPSFSMDKQMEIASIFDKIDDLIARRKEQVRNMDQAVKSRFIELFTDKGYPIRTINEVSLGKGEYGAQSASTEYDPKRPRYVRITDINDDGTLNDDVVASINPDDDEQYRLEYGDFMFARMGATVGKTYTFISGNQIFAGYLIRYKLNLKLINPRYLFWYTKLDEYWNWVKLNQSGAAQPGINAQKYGALRIPVPPIELQEQFAAFVEQTDKSKLAVQKGLQELEILKKSLMQQYFG